MQRGGLSGRLARIAGGLILFLGLSIVIASGIGAVSISPSEILHLLGNKIFGIGPPGQPELEQILFQFRLPRVALAAIVGFALSLAGGAFQGMLLNPLADPYLIGVSAGAAAGASAAILLGLGGIAGGLGITIIAFVVALLTMVVVYRLAQVGGKIPLESFILAGVVVGSFMWALVTFMMSIAGRDLHTVVLWLMGNLSGQGGWQQVWIALPLVMVGAIGIYAFSRDLNLLSLGEESATQLGVEVEPVKRVIIVLGALVTAAAVCVSGVIGFIGLIMPHIARRLVGPDHRLLLPTAGLIGASFLIWADSLARTMVAPAEIPVGVITALLGAPFFFYLLRMRKRRG